MRIGGRAAAAIEVLTEIATRHRPAGEALRDWGKAHRFAGGGDRAAIGNLVYDALRRRSSHGWIMGNEIPRAIILAVLALDWGLDVGQISSEFAEDRFSPGALSDAEVRALTSRDIQGAPGWIAADFPEWLWETLSESFEDEVVAEGQAMSARPPLDLRVNTLQSDRQKALDSLSDYAATPSEIARQGIRIAPSVGPKRQPNVTPDGAYQKGWIEIQDEGSQIVADLVFAKPGETVLDFCAGGGGKTLALAAIMENKGQVFAYDRDRHRLAPIYDRLKRAETRNVQVLGHKPDALEPLQGKMDKVLVDAPCSGSGTWRRKPETKWKLTQDGLERRIKEQAAVLDQAAVYVRSGGMLCYVTCSILPQENEAQVYAFIDRNPEFSLLSAGEVWEELFGVDGQKPWSADGCTVTLTPASTGTDGFFFAVLQNSD